MDLGDRQHNNRGSAGTPALLRRINARLILHTIRSDGPLSRADIARATGLSKPTVNDVVEGLLQDALIGEGDGFGRLDRPGRRARQLTIRADLGYVLGLDIGADKVLALVADSNGAILARNRRKVVTQARRGPEAMLAEVRAVALGALASAGISLERLKLVGVGTVGIVSPTSGKISLAPHIAGWDGLCLGREVEQWFPCPVLVDGETHLSLLAERRIGAVREIDNVVYVHLGVGVSCGILIGGTIYRGATGAGGEIGYLTLVENAVPPADGSGWFEYHAGARAFARHGRQVAMRPEGILLRDLAGGDPDSVDAEVIFLAAQQGDAAAQGIVNELTGLLSRGIASVVATLNPAAVVIGGGLSRAGEPFIALLAERVRPLVPVPPEFRLSTLGDEAVALGAVQLALDEMDKELFGMG